MDQTVLLDIDAAVGTITLNRPEVFNAQSEQRTNDFNEVLDEVESSEKLRALVLTGVGRGFCAGGDLNHPTFTKSVHRRSTRTEGPQRQPLRIPCCFISPDGTLVVVFQR